MVNEQTALNHTYRFPYRINLPLLILFWDAKQLGVAFLVMAFGNIFECFTLATVVAVVYWYAYNKALELGKRGLMRHRLWWTGFLPGTFVYSSRYFTDPFIRELYS
ncbi:plasmid transfer protein [Photorhabdus heterorhabditis]|uniref:Plasmid transfer protein n=1 Tax=Photorhabdus heterorhabditis TaxID=880156 RepID=A0A5B0WJL6_9GAMM|nr:plasmid transfer protein [Photorhabdus heterorhabditis]MBS9441182.1 plasmid transfer protein [Photorhabdus heterorhabditis]NRN28996.1 plasmid transfer protein [Photorhabdus heterorhabditis subsp. aluminescens]